MQDSKQLNIGSPVEVDQQGLLFVRIFGTLVFLVLALLPFVVIIVNQVPLNSAIKALVIYFSCFILFWGLIWVGVKRGDPRIKQRSKFAVLEGLDFKVFPEEYEGRDITCGSLIASGAEEDYPYGSLLNGTRNGYLFRAIDYGYWSGGSYRPYTAIQTVICIDLKPISCVQFSILSRSLLSRSNLTGKIVLERLLGELSNNKVVVVNADPQGRFFVSDDFIRSFLSMDSANVEYIKDYQQDRLLVYSLYDRLTGKNYFEWIDYAIALAEELQTSARNEQEQS